MEQEHPDVLYIFGSGSRWADNEIRYSLRSIAQYLPHGRVYIVGDRPFFSKGLIHLPTMDPYPHKLKNSIHKLAIGVGREDMSERFYLFNDDFYFLQQAPRVLPVYHRGPLNASIERHPTGQGYYAMALAHTLAKLKKHGYAHPLNYSVHYPMLFEKERVKEVLSKFGGPGNGYAFRTCYGNHFSLGGTQVKDLPGGYCPMKLNQWRDISDAPFISTSDEAVKDARFREFMAERFPDPCQYEA